MKMKLYFDPCTDICVGLQALESGQVSDEIGASPFNCRMIERGEQFWLPNARLTIGREFNLEFYPLGMTIQYLMQFEGVV